MILIIGVRFRKSGKIYYFDPLNFTVKKGDHVIVETARGIEYGKVILEPKKIPDDEIVSPLKPVIRLATPEDDKTNIENKKKEKEAFTICIEKIAKHNLEMKLIDSEYTFDRNKLLFYFTADGRIDFRELVKDLASVFRTRIELRQIGVRDETKLIGGIAICGRPLCCHSYLSDFAPVSIKMAKEQNLSLNPSKISGTCGRLMCCLKNEQEAYEYLNSKLPTIGTRVTTADGYRGEVQSVSVLKQRVKVIVIKEKDEKEVIDYSVNDLNFDSKKKIKGAPIAPPLPDEEIDEAELHQLVKLEEEDLEKLSDDEDNSAPHPKKNFKQDYSQRRNRSNHRKHSDNTENHSESGNSRKPFNGGNRKKQNNNQKNSEENFHQKTGKHYSNSHRFDNQGNENNKNRSNNESRGNNENWGNNENRSFNNGNPRNRNDKRSTPKNRPPQE